MPIYEFKCEKPNCQRITQEMLPISSKRNSVKCAHCEDGKAKRILSVTSGYDMKGYSAKNSYSKGE